MQETSTFKITKDQLASLIDTYSFSINHTDLIELLENNWGGTLLSEKNY